MNTSPSARIGIASVLISCAVFTFMTTSKALAGTGLSIQPIKISETISPGSAVSGSIKLSNAGDSDIFVDVSVEDFVPTAGAATLSFVARSGGVTSVRDWVKIGGSNHFLFKKGAITEIPYTIATPKDAEPGSHFGVIFFKATNAADANASIKVGTQVGVLVFVTVPGDYKQTGIIRSLTAPRFVNSSEVPFEMTFENTGTVYFEPKGTISIKNMFGHEVGRADISGTAILPTGIKTINIPWVVSGFLIGRYTATASILSATGTVMTSSSTAFYAFPIWYILGFILVLAVLYWLIKLLKSKVKISIRQ